MVGFVNDDEIGRGLALKAADESLYGCHMTERGAPRRVVGGHKAMRDIEHLQ